MIPSVLSFLFINLKMGNYLSILINQTLIIKLTFNHLLEIIREQILSLLKKIDIGVYYKSWYIIIKYTRKKKIRMNSEL